MGVLSAQEIIDRSNHQTLRDIGWASRSMGTTIPRFDQNGKQNGETSVNIEAAWSAANFAKVNGKLDAILNIVGQFAKGQGVQIDYGKVEEAAAAGTRKALEESTVKVDVTVQGAPSNG